jgi:hypothetical protein
MDQSEDFCHFIARVAENVEGQAVFLDEFAIEFFDLGRNGYQGGAKVRYGACGLLKSFQLQVAVRSPGAAIKGQHHGAVF